MHCISGFAAAQLQLLFGFSVMLKGNIVLAFIVTTVIRVYTFIALKVLSPALVDDFDDNNCTEDEGEIIKTGRWHISE